MEETFLSRNLAAHPELVAIGVLVLGFFVARLASLALGNALGALDRRMARLTTTESSAFSPRMIALSRAFVFWLVLILAVMLAVRRLDGGGASLGLNDNAIAFIPNALIAFAIVVAGHLLGLLASNLLIKLNEDLPAESFGPRLLHGAIVVVAIVMGLKHIGVDITFVTRLLLILVAVVGGGLMLAFALGAKRHVANLLAHREVGRLAIGQRIRVDGVEGSIVEIHSTGVDVATKEGIASIPAARFAELCVLRLREDEHGG